MKKLLTLFFFTITFSVYSQKFVCSFDGINNSIEVKNSFFDNDVKINPLVERILNIVGLEKNFILVKDNSINNCYALTFQGIRFIIYDQSFLDKITKINNDNNSWTSLSILAHEIGHHLQGHTIKESSNLIERKKEELEADKFSGFILQSLGASLKQSLLAINTLKNNTETINSTHPNKIFRINSITDGFNQSKMLSEKIMSQKLKNIEIQKATLVQNEIKKEMDELYYNKAQLCISQNNIECAIDYITTILTISKNNNFALIQRAYLKSMKGDFKSSLSDYNKALTDYKINNKENSTQYFLGNHIYYNRAITYEKMEDFENAIKDYKEAIKLLGNDQIIWLKLGTVYTKTNENELAIFTFNKGFEKPIENLGLQKFTLADIYLSRGISYYYSRNADSSIINLKKSISNFPTNHPNKILPNYYLGLSYSALKNYDEAIECFNNFIDKTVSNVQDEQISNANFYLGLTYQKKYFVDFKDKNLISKSLNAFTKAFKINSKNSDILYYRSLSYQLLLDNMNACNDLKIACELDNKMACEKLSKECKN